MKRRTRLLKVAGMLAILFGAGIALGVGYRWYQGSIVPAPFFVTAAGNVAPSEAEALTPNVAAVSNPATPAAIPLPSSSSAMISNATQLRPRRRAPVGQQRCRVASDQAVAAPTAIRRQRVDAAAGATKRVAGGPSAGHRQREIRSRQMVASFVVPRQRIGYFKASVGETVAATWPRGRSQITGRLSIARESLGGVKKPERLQAL